MQLSTSKENPEQSGLTHMPQVTPTEHRAFDSTAATATIPASAHAAYNLPYVWAITFAVALGGLLFGYDWVVILYQGSIDMLHGAILEAQQPIASRGPAYA